MRVLTHAEAIDLIPDGGTVAISGGGYRGVPEGLLRGIGERYAATASPGRLTVIAISMIERTRGGVGGEGTGLNRLAADGLMSCLISGSFSRAPERSLNRAIDEDRITAYNAPMGTIVQWLRSIGAGRSAFYTPVGLGTFVDPRDGGGAANASAVADPLATLVEIDGEEMIRYPRRTIDIGLVRAVAADERGNLYLDGQSYDHGSIDVAMAARNSGGIVIAEVNELLAFGTRHARHVRVPGAMVDVVVVSDEAPWEDEQAEMLSGARPVELPAPLHRHRPRDVVAAMAVDLLPEGAVVNVGAGIPMYDVPEAARRKGRTDLYFTIEHGPMGGWPQVGGVSRNPDAILGQHEVFQFYEGGGPDVAVLSFGQIDASGNVNVSRFGRMRPGCGGFPNIAHGVRRLILCGSITTGGGVSRLEGGRVEIVEEGRIRRFVETLDEITFNAPRALSAGHRITVVTERAVFKVTPDGLVLTAVAPGIDTERDILELIEFPVRVSDELETIDAGYFLGDVG